MKNKFLIIILFFFGGNLSAQQVVNYRYDGEKLKSTTDFFQLSIIDTTKSNWDKSITAGSILTSVLGSVVTIGLDLINGAIAKKQATYTATYSNTYVFYVDKIAYDFLPTIYQLVLRRYAINSMGDPLNTANLMTEYRFKFDAVTKTSMQLSLVYINLPYSKARCKKDESLAISIDIKISNGASPDTSTKSSPGSLGDNNVKIPIVQPSNTAYRIPPEYGQISHANYQGFAQPATGQPLPLTITITVTEANLEHLAPSLVANLLKNNGSDLVSVLKAVLPSSSGSGSTGGKQ